MRHKILYILRLLYLVALIVLFGNLNILLLKYTFYLNNPSYYGYFENNQIGIIGVVLLDATVIYFLYKKSFSMIVILLNNLYN